jgi:hypothetical protein
MKEILMQKQCKVGRMVLLAVLMSCFCLPSFSSAALLGIVPTKPDLFSDNGGTYSYNSTTNLFDIDARPLFIAFDNNMANNANFNLKYSGSWYYDARFYVDENGKFNSGITNEDDVAIYGEITFGNTTYSGKLLTGEVLAFGFDGAGSTTRFDYIFEISGGQLADLFGGIGKIAGSKVNPETSTFANWTDSHSGTNPKIDTFATPIPAAAWLLGTGLIGLVGIRRRFKK